MNTEIPQIRPRVLSEETFLFLDKVRAFHHFIRHAYDCELQEVELTEIQNKLKAHYRAWTRTFQSSDNLSSD